MNKIILLMFALFIFASCKTKQVATTKEYIAVHDTFRDLRIIERIRPIHDTLLIENPCDSLGLKDFNYKSNLPYGKIEIRSLKGKIRATINMDSISNVYDSKYKSKYDSEVKFFEKIVTRNVVPTWAIVTIFLESLIIVGYFYFRFINPFK